MKFLLIPIALLLLTLAYFKHNESNRFNREWKQYENQVKTQETELSQPFKETEEFTKRRVEGEPTIDLQSYIIKQEAKKLIGSN